jgi:endo-1,4-beta-xylanase
MEIVMTLKEKYKNYFLIGAEVNTRTIKTHQELICKHFDSITCENEMKFESLRPLPDKETFIGADTIAAFAKENGLKLRGHTFVWHGQTPGWVYLEADKELLLKRMKEHITKVGEHFKEDTYCWDVVNEAIEDKKDIVMRDSFWTQIIGEDFMDYAFNYAKQVLPNQGLFYNDYNETDPVKRQKIYQRIKDMLHKGIPIGGIGMQCHINIYEPGVDQMKAAIELYATLGLRLHITEMDVSLFRFGDQSKFEEPNNELIKLQAKQYKDYFNVFREYRDVIDCVTLWGVADDATWLSNFPTRNRKNWPLLFDDNHNEKEAFYAIMDF